MIHVTGDTHIPVDISKLRSKKFPKQKEMTKDDYVIICGDFGGVWSNHGNEDRYWQNWLDERRFTTLFVDGNHENFDMLEQYEVSEWNGGKVHRINDSIIHLMRGQVFEIEGKKFFTMGGAQSIDKHLRKEGKSWWPQEMPSDAEYDEAIDSLDRHDWKVDYVITHTTSRNMMELMGYPRENTQLNGFFGHLEKYLEYQHWYFGHFHRDAALDPKSTVVYNEIIKLT